jgi:beta-lactamase regulating signal transducer with metallopeptidase domain
VDDLLGVGLGNALAATVLAGLAAAAVWLGVRPALAHRFWLLVLLKLVTPPLILVPVLTVAAAPERPPAAVEPVTVAEPAAAVPVEVEPEPAAAAEFVPSPPPAAPPAPGRRFPGWRTALAGVWLAGSLAWWALVAGRMRRFGRLLRAATPAPAEVQSRARELAGRLGLRRCPGVWFVPVRVPPLVWAVVGRPRVLVPADLWGGLDGGQRDALVLHELAHLRRGDHWVRRLELVVLGLYWWLPAVWWARRALEAAEERCCDAWVVWARPAAASDYALALLRTVEFLAGGPAARPAAASAAGPVRDLKRRLTMILKETPPRTPARAGWWALVVLAAVVLPWLPTWAQTRSESQPPAPAAENPLRASAEARFRAFTEGGPRPVGGDMRPPGAGEAPRGGDEDPPAPAPDGGRAELIAEARDRVELAVAEVTVKRAELMAAKVILDSAQNHLARFEALRNQNTVALSEVEQARSAAVSAQANVLVKEAELQQSEVRLRMARRRLEALEGAPRGAPPGGRGAKVSDLFEDRTHTAILPTGSLAKGRVVLTNTTDRTVRVGTVRSSGGFLSATARPESAAPGETIDVELTIDGRRFVGMKEGVVSVVFAEPAGKETRIHVRTAPADAGTPGGGPTTSSTSSSPFGGATTAGSSNTPSNPFGTPSGGTATTSSGGSTTSGSIRGPAAEDRIKALERKLADMQKELEELRKSQRGNPPGSNR